MTEAFDYFPERILGGGRIHPDGEHGLVDMRVLDAVHEGADTDGVVGISAHRRANWPT